MDTFHDHFTADSRHAGVYHWTTAKPLFKQAVVAYAPPYETEVNSSDRIDITAICENGNIFGKFHELAWEYITQNAQDIESRLCQKLFANHQNAYKGFVEECVTDLDGWELEDWNRIKTKIDWRELSAVYHLYELCGISLLDDGLDDCGFCFFDFKSGWNEEHGMSIVMHRNRILRCS